MMEGSPEAVPNIRRSGIPTSCGRCVTPSSSAIPLNPSNTSTPESNSRGSAIPRLQFKNSNELPKISNVRSKSCDEVSKSEVGFKSKLGGISEKNERNNENDGVKFVLEHATKPLKNEQFERSKSEHQKSSSPTRSNADSVCSRRPRSSSVSASANKILEEPILKKFDKKKKNVSRVSIVENVRPKPEIAFFKKKRQLDKLKEGLIEKQNAVVEAYNELLTLKHEAETTLGKPVEVEHMKVVDFDNQFAAPNKIDSETVIKMNENLESIGSSYTQVCEEILRNRLSILDWLGSQSFCKNICLTKQVEHYKKESEQLQKKLSNCIKQQENTIGKLTNDWAALWQWKENCLNEEYVDYKTENKKLMEKIEQYRNELDKNQVEKIENDRKLLDTERELVEVKKELQTKEQLLESADKLRSSEDKVAIKLAKQRLRDAETKVKILEQKIETLSKQIKKSEENWKVKENLHDNHTKEIVKATKFKESLISKLEKERNSFETRSKDLEEMLETKENEYNTNMAQLKESLDQTTNTLNNLQVEFEKSEKKYADVREKLVKMQIKQTEEAEQAKKRKFVNTTYPPEAEMWNELQATKIALKAAEEQLNRKIEERNRFMKTINKSMKEEASIDVLTARLICKDEEIESLKYKYSQLQEAIVYSQDLASKQERKIAELKKTLDTLAVNDDGLQTDARKSDTDYLLDEYKEKLDQTVAKNIALEEKLVAKETALAQAERKVQEQENLLQVRNGIIGIMKSKKEITSNEYENLREYVQELMHQYNVVNSKLQQKSEQMDNMYTSLEFKTMEIDRLDKTIKSMEQLCKETNLQNLQQQEKIQYFQKTIKEYQQQIAELSASPERSTWKFFQSSRKEVVTEATH